MCEKVSPFKSDVLSGHVALVTGGTSGIGLEIARFLGAAQRGQLPLRLTPLPPQRVPDAGGAGPRVRG